VSYQKNNAGTTINDKIYYRVLCECKNIGYYIYILEAYARKHHTKVPDIMCNKIRAMRSIEKVKKYVVHVYWEGTQCFKDAAIPYCCAEPL